MMPDEQDFYSSSPTVEGRLKLLHDRLRHPADVKVTGDALRKLELLQQITEAAESLCLLLKSNPPAVDRAIAQGKLVIRALRELAIDNEDSTPIQRAIDDSTTALIRAVDAQYPEGYDEEGGLEILEVNGRRCYDCWRIGAHEPDCHKWNTRVALLALCRDILGEKG